MGFNDIDCGANCSIVVQRTGAMGDVIWTTPLFKYMRDAGFKGSISVATQHPEVFANNPYVTDVVSPAYAKNVMRQDGAWNLDWSYESNRKKHMLAAYCEVLGVDYTRVVHRPMLYPTVTDMQWAASVRQEKCMSGGYSGVIVVHAAATSPDRIWSSLRWEQFTTWLLSLGFFVICVGAQHDYHLKARSGVLDLVDRTTLSSVNALIESADAFVGTDSGIANVAFSTQTLSLVLYGMAFPYTRLPLGSTIHHGFIASDCDCIGCLEKLPATAPPLCGEFPKAKCMDSITVSDLISVFTSKILSNLRPSQLH